MTCVEVRLERIERRYRTLQRCCLLLILSTAGLALTAQTRAVPKVVESQQFLLKSADGKTLGQWVALPNGTSALKLQNATGAPGIVVSAGADGTAAVQIKNPSGSAMTMAVVGENSVISFDDKAGRTLYKMGVDDTGRFSSSK